MRRAAGTVVAGAIALGCTGPPWFMGRPLDDGADRAALPDATPTPSALRARAEEAARACHPAEELAALVALERRARLREQERARVAALLLARADALAAFGRPTVAERDRRRALALDRAAGAARVGCAQRTGGLVTRALASVAVTPILVPAVATGALDAQPRGPALAAVAALAIEEDPESPDALFAAATLAARAGRAAWGDRVVDAAVAASRDRLAALARAAGLWQREGEPRRACRRWLERARMAATSDDEGWDHVFACAVRDPSIGDADLVRRWVLEDTPPGRREARDDRLQRVSGAVLRTDAAAL